MLEPFKAVAAFSNSAQLNGGNASANLAVFKLLLPLLSGRLQCSLSLDASESLSSNVPLWLAITVARPTHIAF